MVKGISKRAVVVRAPASPMFEEVIFIVREGALTERGVSEDALFREACSVAERCAKTPKRRIRRSTVLAALLVAFGASLTGAAWLLCTML